MKININTTTGFYAENCISSSNEVKIEGILANEYPFNERWDDLSAVVDEGGANAALTYEGYRDTDFYMKFFRHNQDDIIFMKYQMPHSWDPTTAIKPHAHVIPMASGSGVAKFNFIYTWCPVNAVIGAASTWVTGSTSASFTPADQYKHKAVGHISIQPPSGATESIIFLLKIERPGASDATDTYTTNKDHGTTSANLALLFFDLHYQKIKAGTVTEYPDG